MASGLLPSLVNDFDEYAERVTEPPRLKPLLKPPETSRPSGPARPKSGGRVLCHDADDSLLLSEPDQDFPVVPPSAPEPKACVSRARRIQQCKSHVAPNQRGGLEPLSRTQNVDHDFLGRPAVLDEVQEIVDAMRDHKVHIVHMGVEKETPYVIGGEEKTTESPRVEDIFNISRGAIAFLILIYPSCLKKACAFVVKMRETRVWTPTVVGVVLRAAKASFKVDVILNMAESLANAGIDNVIVQPRLKDDLPELLASALGFTKVQWETSKSMVKRASDDRANHMFFQDAHTMLKHFPKMNGNVPEQEGSKEKGLGGVGRHVFAKKLGSGKYGKVFLIKPTEDSNSMEVVKVIPKAAIRNTKHAIQLLKECRFLEKVSSHPNIVNFRGVVHARHNFYIFMEAGGDTNLGNIIRFAPNARLGSPQSHGFISQVSSAVAYCHDQNVAHRDLKPDNVVVNSSNIAKLVDFGLAVSASDLCEDKCGTVPFSPPEVYRGQAFDPKSMDVWGLGVMLIEMVCGNHSLCKMMGYSQVPEPNSSLAEAVEAFFQPRWQTNMQAKDGISPTLVKAMTDSLMIVPAERCTAIAFHEQVSTIMDDAGRPHVASYTGRAAGALPALDSAAGAPGFNDSSMEYIRETFD